MNDGPKSADPIRALARLDVNLLLVLHVVLETRSATRAAERLHVTQAAVSNALARLRDALGDPLFVRQGRGLAPTPRALEMAPVISRAMEALGAIASPSAPFDPKTTTRELTLACTDDQALSDVPRLLERFLAAMPEARLRIVSVEHLVATDGLASGAVDVAIAPAALEQPGLHRAPLGDATGRLVVRRDHPVVRGSKVTRAQYLALGHVDVRIVGERGYGARAQDAFLRAHGLEGRRVRLVVPHFMAAALAASRTDLVAAVPGAFVPLVTELLPLRAVSPPFPAPSFPLALVWHERTHADAAAKFFRKLVRDALA